MESFRGLALLDNEMSQHFQGSFYWDPFTVLSVACMGKESMIYFKLTGGFEKCILDFLISVLFI